MANRGRKPLSREMNFYVNGSRKEYKALSANFAAIQAVFKTASQMRIEQAQKLARNIAKAFGLDYKIDADGKGYDYSLSITLGEKAVLQIEQARAA